MWRISSQSCHLTSSSTSSPLRTISECRWVCKSWYEFILHPRFAEIHFAKYRDSFPCAIFLSRYRTSYLIDPECLSKYETTATAYDLNLKDFRQNFTISNGWNCFDVVGTVNGLVCFSPERGDHEPAAYYIVNPITRDHVLLPKSPKVELEPLGSGFGFDSLTKEYKLVRILRNPLIGAWIEKKYGNKKCQVEDVNEVPMKYVNEVEIYTLGSGSWRESHLSINIPGLVITGMKIGCVLLNGCLHWVLHVMRESDDESCRVILSFNLAAEEFKLIDMPPSLREPKRSSRSHLIVLDDHLCIIDGDLFHDKDVWVMKVYGLHSTWDKTYVFRKKVFSALWHGCHEVMELKNNDLLLLNETDNLSYYDRQKKVSNVIALHDIKRKPVKVEPDFPIYLKGSLFSPKTIELNHRACLCFVFNELLVKIIFVMELVWSRIIYYDILPNTQISKIPLFLLT
ncbi:hypothetical protein ACHQM5_016778 [Ranunculus cassubicifolius]